MALRAILLILLIHLTVLQAASVTQTKHQLQHLDQKISLLTQQIEQAQGQQSNIEQTLAMQDQIQGLLVCRLNQTMRELRKKQRQVKALTEHIATLSRELNRQQLLLTKQIQVQYRQAKPSVLKRIVDGQSVQRLHQWLTACEYVNAARKQLISAFLLTHAELETAKLALKQDLQSQKNRQAQLLLDQKRLEGLKVEQESLMKTIVNRIQTNKQTLTDYRQDKASLERVLQRLLATAPPHSTMIASVPMIPAPPSSVAKWHHHAPLRGKDFSVRPFSQGLLFMAPEGRVVQAVASGKVVFSDWLRGYGLLLILEHEQGLMTLYAYNQSLFTHQGERVRAGQQIATVGHSGGRLNNGLYFEVRRLGKVISATSFLSKQA